jgi:hypothetical protein
MKMDLNVPKEHTPVSCIAFSELGKFMAAAWTGSPTTRLYSLHKGCQHVDMLEGEHKSTTVNKLAFDKFGNFLASATDTGVNLFYYRQPNKPMGHIKSQAPVTAVQFDMSQASTGKELCYRTNEGTVHVAKRV